MGLLFIYFTEHIVFNKTATDIEKSHRNAPSYYAMINTQAIVTHFHVFLKKKKNLKSPEMHSVPTYLFRSM